MLCKKKKKKKFAVFLFVFQLAGMLLNRHRSMYKHTVKKCCRVGCLHPIGGVKRIHVSSVMFFLCLVLLIPIFFPFPFDVFFVVASLSTPPLPLPHSTPPTLRSSYRCFLTSVKGNSTNEHSLQETSHKSGQLECQWSEQSC